MEIQPLVTIYTITRNRADLLPRCMKSVLNQTYNNIEYIIIDSASEDNTEEVVKSFDDDRIRYIKLHENKTFGACINMAASLATGKYFTELDDDDEYHLDKIEKQVALFETLPEDYGMVYCWMTYYDNKTGKLLNIHKASFRGNVIKDVIARPTVSGTPSLLIKTELFRNIGGYKEADEIGIESDWELAARVCNSSKVDFVPESLVNVYVNHGHLRMSNKGYYKDSAERNIKFHIYMLNEFADTFNLYPAKKTLHYRNLTYNFIMVGNYTQGFKYYTKLLKVSLSLKNLCSFPYYVCKKLAYGNF